MASSSLQQNFQMLTGTLSSGGKNVSIEKGRLRGDEISFVAGGVEYTGKVDGNTMTGDSARQPLDGDAQVVRLPKPSQPAAGNAQRP